MASSPSLADPESSRASLRFVSAPARQALWPLLRLTVPAFVFFFPLLVWPGLARPFSSPKLVAWGVAALLFSAVQLAVRRSQSAQTSTLAVASFSLLVACLGISAGLAARADIESLLLVLTALVWFVLLRRAELSAHAVSRALAGAAAVLALVSLFQFAGADPFHRLGWFAVGGTSARMHIYATLGNPNFVGAFLAGALPVTIALAFHRRRLRQLFAVAALLQAMAIVATGSRAAALGALLGCGLLLARTASSRKWLTLALCLSLLLPVLGLSHARSLPDTAQGRLFVWRVALPHLASIPVFGHGPGAFAEQFDQWQQDYFRAGNAPQDARFAAPFDHAHNDFLEWTVEYGWAGIAALAACLGLFLLCAWRAGRASLLAWAALAGAGGLALIALLDFPFHRPEGLFLLTTLMAMACAGSQTQANCKGETACPRAMQSESR